MVSDLPDTCDPRIRRLAEYLAAKAPPGKLPGRQHVSPDKIPELLSYVTLFDVIPQRDGTRRYRARLAGTHVVDLMGIDPTGKFLDQYLPAEESSAVRERYDQVVLTKQPSYRAGLLQNPGREHVRFQRAAFPLARDGEKVDMLIVIRVGGSALRQRSILSPT